MGLSGGVDGVGCGGIGVDVDGGGIGSWVDITGTTINDGSMSERLVPVSKQKGMEVGVVVGLRLVEVNSQ